MDGRENLTRAIEFRGPEHLPVHVDVNFDWLLDKDENAINEIKDLMKQTRTDMVLEGYHHPNDPARDGCPLGSWSDEWGIGWFNDGHGGRVDQNPLAEGYHLLKDYIFPIAGDKSWFEKAKRLFETNGDKFHVGMVWYTLFERLWMLRGFNNILMDPYVDTENFMYLRDMIVEFNLAQIDVWGEMNADAVYFSDDWGSQRALLMNPDDWRRFYKPSYEKMFKRAIEKGMKVFMHLCGNVTEIIPDLVELGLDVLNPVQPQAMDLEYLAKEFGGRLCFYGGVDVQGTMVYGRPGDVSDEVERLVDLFGSFGGGYILGTSHSIMPETPLENIQALFEAILAQ